MSIKILSVNDCNEIDQLVSQFGREVRNYYDQYERAIKIFNNNDIVRSFHESGPFGKKKEEELNKVINAVKRYVDVIESGKDALVPKTRQFISGQLELLNANAASARNTGSSFDGFTGRIDELR